MNNTGGKGSAPRPIGVDKETFSNNWVAIFGKKKEKSIAEIYEEIKEFSKKHSITLVSTKTRETNNLESSLDSIHSGLIDNPDFTNGAEGWKSDSKTHVTNTDVGCTCIINPDLNLYLVRLTDECFNKNNIFSNHPDLIAAKDEHDVMRYHGCYLVSESKQDFVITYVGKASPTLSEGIVKF